MTVSFAFIVMQLNKYGVVCDTVLHRGHSDDGDLPVLILFICMNVGWDIYLF